MSEKPAIAIFADNAAQRAYLAEIVRLAGGEPVVDGAADTQSRLFLVVDGAAGPDMTGALAVLRLGKSQMEAGEGVRVIAPPTRAGELVDLVARHLVRAASLPESIDIAGNMLDIRHSLWSAKDGKDPVRLTEKEVSLLVALKESAPLPVPREALLGKVWAYADGVETHTLETHIYRLRQKIESDPANPKILLTNEDGYFLAG